MVKLLSEMPFFLIDSYFDVFLFEDIFDKAEISTKVTQYWRL